MLLCIIPAFNTRNEDDLKVIGGNTLNQPRTDGAYFDVYLDSAENLEHIDYLVLFEDFTSVSGGLTLPITCDTNLKYLRKVCSAFENARTHQDSVNVYVQIVIPELFGFENDEVMNWWGSWNVIGDTLEIKSIQPKRRCVSDVLHARYFISADTTLVGIDIFYSEKKHPCRESIHCVYNFRDDFPKPDSTNSEWKYWKSKK